MTGRAAALGVVLRPPILTRSLAVALLVGTLLNFINQGDRLLAGELPDWRKLALTFVVPFLVASYAAWAALLSTGKG